MFCYAKPNKKESDFFLQNRFDVLFNLRLSNQPPNFDVPMKYIVAVCGMPNFGSKLNLIMMMIILYV